MAKDIVKMLKKEAIPIITEEMNKTEDGSFPEQQRGAALNAMLLYSYLEQEGKKIWRGLGISGNYHYDRQYVIRMGILSPEEIGELKYNSENPDHLKRIRRIFEKI